MGIMGGGGKKQILIDRNPLIFYTMQCNALGPAEHS
jgi:hypothetical protein